MGRSEEPNMGLPILGSQYLANFSFWVQMTQRKKCDPERMKAAIEAMRNKEMGSYKASRVFNVPQTTPEHYVKDRQKISSKAITTKLGRKQVLPCEAENDLAEYCLLLERQFFGLTMADVLHFAYQLPVRNGIRNQFRKRNEKTGGKWLQNFLLHHQ